MLLQSNHIAVACEMLLMTDKKKKLNKLDKEKEKLNYNFQFRIEMKTIGRRGSSFTQKTNSVERSTLTRMIATDATKDEYLGGNAN